VIRGVTAHGYEVHFNGWQPRFDISEFFQQQHSWHAQHTTRSLRGGE
jgi:hypothetical protein